MDKYPLSYRAQPAAFPSDAPRFRRLPTTLIDQLAASVGITPLPSHRGHTGSRPVRESRESLPRPLQVGHVGSSSFLSMVNPNHRVAPAG
jgi:hypothetical protein